MQTTQTPVDGATIAALRSGLATHGLLLTSSDGERELLDAAGLAEHEPRPGVLRRADGTRIADLTVVFASPMAFAEVGRHARGSGSGGTLLVLGAYVTDRDAVALRAAGVDHLDARGNAWFRHPGLSVDVRGRAPADRADRADRVPAPVSRMQLLSPRRAQVVFALISWPELTRAPVQRIADAAQVSPGLARDTLKMLHREGHLTTWPARRLRRIPVLIDRFVAAFPTGLGSLERTSGFHSATPLIPTVGDHPIRVSGEAAVPGGRGETAVVYTEEDDTRLALRHGWRSGGDTNVLVRDMFWTDPHDDEDDLDLRSAPPLAVYADLMATDGRRQRKAATDLRKADSGLRAT